MEESSDSENPATGKMSGSQVNTDWDSGSHAASPTPAVDSQPADRGNTQGEPDRQPPDRGNRQGESDNQPPDRGNTEGETDRQPPDRGNGQGEPDSQVLVIEDEPSAPRLQQFNQPGSRDNTQIYRVDQMNIFQGNDQLQSIAARTSTNLETACPQGYVKTSGYYRALMEMKKHGCCMITGTSGSGKTTLAQHLLLALHDKKYLPLEFITPDECQCVPWQKVGDEKLKLVLLVDNVVGAGNYDDELRKKWEIQLKPMKPFIERGHVLVILASRASIYAAIRGVKGSGQVLYEAPVVSLAFGHYQLSLTEKEEILKKILAFHDTKIPHRVFIGDMIFASESNIKIGFPQLCVYLATSQTALSNPVDFFRNPLQFLEREFQKLRLEDRLSYFVLILVLLRGGSLSEEVLRTQGNKEFVKEVADLVGLSRAPGSGNVLETASQLCESFLKYNSQSKCFSFTHQSVWDVLFSEMCRSDLEKAANVCSWKQLALYVRTDPKCKENEEFVYVVPPCDWPILAQRLLQELTSGDVARACSHPCLRHPDFVQELVEKFLTGTVISSLLEIRQQFVDVVCRYEKVRREMRFSCVYSRESESLIIFSFWSPINYFILRRCSSVAKHILQSASQSPPSGNSRCKKILLESFCLQKMINPRQTPSDLVTEALACAFYVSDPDLVDWLLDRGAVPSQECVRAACCAEQEHVGLVERALQWDHALSVELLTEMARVACQQDKPNTLELILSHLPKSAIIQAELDLILAEVILLTHPKQQCKVHNWRQNAVIELTYDAIILSTLKKAGAQFRSYINPHTAAGHTDSSALFEWLEHKVNLSAKDEDDYTLLHHAAQTGALSNVQALLDVMESTGQLAQLMNVQTEKGDTALHLAADKGRLAVVEALLNKGADANLTNRMGETALLKLASCMKWKMDDSVLISEHQGAPSSSPQALAFQGHQNDFSAIRVKEMLRLFSSNEMYCNEFICCVRFIGRRNFETYLHTASKNGHSLLMEVLMERGVDVNLTDDTGSAPVHYAAERGHVDVLEVLSRNSAQLDARDSCGRTALHIAARMGHLPVVDMLIQNKVNVNAKNERERTPLHEASIGGHDQIIKNLLDNGARANAIDADGQHPLHLAACGSHFSAVKCLMVGGASVNAKNKDNRTCFHTACGAGDISTIEFFLTRGACLNASDESGFLPLHLAINNGRFPAAQFLIYSGAEVDAADLNGNTSLHLLAANKTVTSYWDDKSEMHAIMSLLKKLGCLIDHQNKQGDTPVMLAVQKQNYKVLRGLLELPCDLSISNSEGNTALHLALAQITKLGKDKAAEECMLAMVAKCVKLLQIKSKDGEVPLLLAVRTGSFFLLKEIQKFSIDYSVKGKGGNTILHELGHRFVDQDTEKDESFKQMVEFVVSRSADFINCPNDDGDTPVLTAAWNRRWLLLSFILRHPVDLSVRGKGGNTILHNLGQRFVDMDIKKKESMKQMVESIVSRSADLVNCANEDGDTPVLTAARNGQWSFLWSLILKHPVDLSVRGKGGNTILHDLAFGLNCWYFEVNESFRQMVESVVSRSADLVNCPNDIGDTPVLMAVRNGDWLLLSFILKHPVDFSVRGKGGNNILHELVCGVNVWHTKRDESISQMIESLLKRSADLANSLNDDGDTPVLSAARKKEWFLLSLFLAKKYDMKSCDKRGNTLLHCLADSIPPEQLQITHRAIIVVLVEIVDRANEDGDTAMMVAVCRRNAWMVKELMAMRCNISLRNKKGETALYLAIEHGDFSVVDMLLEQNVDVSIQTEQGNCLLHVLAGCKNLEELYKDNEVVRRVMRSLAVKCASLVSCMNSMGETPLHTAIRNGNFSLTTMLFTDDVDASIQTNEGSNLLHVLAAHGILDFKCRHSEAVRGLVGALAQKCSLVNCTDMKGATPLYIAIANRSYSLIEMLLKQEIDYSIQTKEGNSLLHALANHEVFEIDYKHCGTGRQMVRSIVKRCKSLSHGQNNKGETPLYLAFLHGNWFVADLLLEQAGSSVDCREEGLTDKPQEAAGLSLAQEGVRTPLHGLAASRDLQWEQEDAIPRQNLHSWVKWFSHLVNHPDQQGNTPILTALREGNFFVSEQLVQYGADLSVTDAEGNTVLHALVQTKYQPQLTKAIMVLVASVTELAKVAGVTPLTANKEGKSALDILQQTKKTENYLRDILLSLWLSQGK